ARLDFVAPNVAFGGERHSAGAIADAARVAGGVEVPDDPGPRVDRERELIKCLTTGPRGGLAQIDEGRLERGEPFSRSVRPRELIAFENDCARERVSHREDRFREAVFHNGARRTLL